MKVLGRGWQYTTYDLGNGRVLKKYNSTLRAYAIIFLDFLRYGSPAPWNIPKYHQGCKETAVDSMKKVVGGSLDAWMMGSPRVLNELDYEQDKIAPLHCQINKAGLSEGKRLVDAFVAFNLLLVERSLIDKSFNITKNFGLDAQGRVVLMDLGELYSSKAAIDEQRRKRMWASPYVVRAIPNKEVRDYYIEQMDRNFALSVPASEEV